MRDFLAAMAFLVGVSVVVLLPIVLLAYWLLPPSPVCGDGEVKIISRNFQEFCVVGRSASGNAP